GEELLDLADRFEPFALPSAVADRTGRLDRPVVHAHHRRRRSRCPLQQPTVVFPQRPFQRLQTRRGKQGSESFAPDFSQTVHWFVSFPKRGSKTVQRNQNTLLGSVYISSLCCQDFIVHFCPYIYN